MATTICGGERRLHQNYNHLQTDDITTLAPPPPAPSPATGASHSSLPAPSFPNPILPSTSFSRPPLLPAQVDFRLLVSGVGNSIERMLRSVKAWDPEGGAGCGQGGGGAVLPAAGRKDEQCRTKIGKSVASRDYALGLHLAMEDGQFFANTNKGPLSFGVDPDTIVVTIGDQLMEWSGRDFKCASGEVIFESNMNGSEASSSSYSLELKCSPLNLNFGYTKKNTNKISIVDQILALLILSFLYKLLFSSNP
ncbi:hypothetical protein V2J09_012173 [Rumex salicifolius]